MSIVPESPRWLVSLGRYADAKVIIKRVAKINGRNDVNVDDLMARVCGKNWYIAKSRANLNFFTKKIFSKDLIPKI